MRSAPGCTALLSPCESRIRVFLRLPTAAGLATCPLSTGTSAAWQACPQAHIAPAVGGGNGVALMLTRRTRPTHLEPPFRRTARALPATMMPGTLGRMPDDDAKTDPRRTDCLRRPRTDGLRKEGSCREGR